MYPSSQDRRTRFAFSQSDAQPPLPAEKMERNHRVNRIRSRVEHVFAGISQMGAQLCRCTDLARLTSTIAEITLSRTDPTRIIGKLPTSCAGFFAESVRE
jgi:hypothetical protein